MKSTNNYILPFTEQRRLHDRAYRAQQRDQSEVCGALLANGDRMLQLHFMMNRAGRPMAWSLCRKDLLALRRGVSSTDWKVVGTFHSHPISEAIPGPRDFDSLPVRQLQLIYDVCGRKSRLWTRTSKATGAIPKELALRRTPRPNKARLATAEVVAVAMPFSSSNLKRVVHAPSRPSGASA
jgi:proteasome lid subunit RPN8/RPN11